MPSPQPYPDLVLKESGRNALKRRHPWIFSGAILKHTCQDGDTVRVVDKKGNFLAIGYYQTGSIAVRVLSFEDIRIDQAYWDRAVGKAVQLRHQLGLPSSETSAYRLIHAEGDGLPGLVIDVYGHTAVVQCHTQAMHHHRASIAQSVVTNSGGQIAHVYDKSAKTLPKPYADGAVDGYLVGQHETIRVLENGRTFFIDLESGQKTGFFLDQRDNRQLLGQYANGRSVLNLYAYTGGFSVYALTSGALKVTSVDASSAAMALLERNMATADNAAEHNYDARTEDVPTFLKSCQDDLYDIIIVDPPAFAKSLRKRHNAVQAYKRVNAAAIKKVKRKGLLFTFSCSQVVDSKLFYDTITAAAIEAGRPCQVLHHLSQGADHPVSIFHPEGKYLKGLVLAVD